MNISNNSIDAEWERYIMEQFNPNLESINKSGYSENNDEPSKIEKINVPQEIHEKVPTCGELYISTKTKVLFLNQSIDIHEIFWKIPILDYWEQRPGIIKKQMKIVSKTQEDYEELVKKLEKEKYYTVNVIKQINNPDARRIKFKDERKITIGMSRKDILCSKGKIKNAFYNCFAIVFRFLYKDEFKELHVKIFNTGKLEIPGIHNFELLEMIKKQIIENISCFVEKELYFLEKNTDDNVLINSNFNCGYYINREKLYNILRNDKYGIETAYEPCSYPGVKCKFYFNSEYDCNDERQSGKIVSEDRTMKMTELEENKKYIEVSFMIFRTGSCLIVGNCNERVLNCVYEFIKKLFYNEYHNICAVSEEFLPKVKGLKLRKKTITVTNNYQKYLSENIN